MPAVHAGYTRYRRALLRAGVELYEYQRFGNRPRHHHGASSSNALHAKTIVVDRRLAWVGSFNLDPRSAELNCEMGVWIDSEVLARQLIAQFEAAIGPENSYAVSLDTARRIRWRETRGGVELEHRRDPGAGWHRRALTWLLGLLPIESQL